MEHEELRRELARADLCRFLAACYYQPGPEFSEESLFVSMHETALHVDRGEAPWVQRLAAAFDGESLEALLVDYTRLFLGPTDLLARPYGSWWLTGEKTLMQDATVAILGLYREGGFEMDEGFRELPDHVAAELEFLYLLLYRRVQARQAGDIPGAERYTRLHRRLLTEHLGRWAEPFADAIARHAGTAFYRSLAQLTRWVVTAEMQPTT